MPLPGTHSPIFLWIAQPSANAISWLLLKGHRRCLIDNMNWELRNGCCVLQAEGSLVGFRVNENAKRLKADSARQKAGQAHWLIKKKKNNTQKNTHIGMYDWLCMTVCVCVCVSRLWGYNCECQRVIKQRSKTRTWQMGLRCVVSHCAIASSYLSRSVSQ